MAEELWNDYCYCHYSNKSIYFYNHNNVSHIIDWWSTSYSVMGESWAISHEFCLTILGKDYCFLYVNVCQK